MTAEWARCRWVWNECVAVSRKIHAANRDAAEKTTCGPARLDKMLTEARTTMSWLREGASVPRQQTIRDFAKSRAKALKDIKAKLPLQQRAGMPRIKRKRDALPTLNYTTRGFRLRDGRPHLAGGIVLTVVWSRDLPAAPTSVRVYQDSLGHWYASFVVATELRPLSATGRVLGVDWGVGETATTTSDAHDLPHAEHGEKAARRLAHYQRMTARRRPARGQAASNGYRQARRQTAKVHKKVARQRQDTARKWAKSVVRDHDAIAVEDFRPKFLAKTTMARKAADAAIGVTKTALIEMGRKHARDIHLSERTYTCTACAVVSPRDKNSARVMLVRAGLSPAGVDRVRAGGPLVPSQREPGIPVL
ncbi:RNA-guided endonuclease InsQ/TnpB family protein [Streptomyces sp. WMMC905]|uniref:RNA-guided endonuclease InsQ/TnpB family protein n=1 Tax=Streptomyces sp. WMMC905 TaxID=3404123 RepID=UPI003B927E0C